MDIRSASVPSILCARDVVNCFIALFSSIILDFKEALSKGLSVSTDFWGVSPASIPNANAGCKMFYMPQGEAYGKFQGCVSAKKTITRILFNKIYIRGG